MDYSTVDCIQFFNPHFLIIYLLCIETIFMKSQLRQLNCIEMNSLSLINFLTEPKRIQNWLIEILCCIKQVSMQLIGEIEKMRKTVHIYFGALNVYNARILSPLAQYLNGTQNNSRGHILFLCFVSGKSQRYINSGRTTMPHCCVWVI